jgi:hypothetical protein
MSVKEFERGMGLLAHAQEGAQGRWIVTPQKGVPFLGSGERARVRARERRRHVFIFLLEGICLTFLIGLVPPLRSIWIATGVLAGLLVLYAWLLLTIKARAARHDPHAGARAARLPERSLPGEAAPRYVAQGSGTRARPVFNGLGSVDEGDDVHVVLLPAGEKLSTVGA